MKRFTSPTQQRGEIAETAVCNYLIRHGFTIMERNFTRKYGEIDIIAQRQERVHFIEVKSISGNSFDFKPENRVGYHKSRRLIKTIESYLLIHDTVDWQIDIVCVYLNLINRRARIKIMSDIIFS